MRMLCDIPVLFGKWNCMPISYTRTSHLATSNPIPETTMSVYIYLIWTHCNQHCHRKHWYTYISHHWHMSLNIYACHIRQVCPTTLAVGLYVDPTVLHIQVKQTMNWNLIYHTISIYVPAKNGPLKWHIYTTHANYCMCTYETTMSVYLPHMNSMQSTNVNMTTGMHTFHFTNTCTWTNMPATLYICLPLHFYCSLHIDLYFSTHPLEWINYNKYYLNYCKICAMNK